MLTVKLKDIELDTLKDGDICFDTGTGRYSLWYKNKYYAIPEEAVELSNLIKNKDKRKVQYCTDSSEMWLYYGISCSCGCNVHRYEYDGENIFIVCNACNECLGTIKDEYLDKYLNKGVWK